MEREGGTAKFISTAASATQARRYLSTYGGAYGYAEFLEVLADPDHEEHDHYVAWSGANFGVSRFDLDAVNQALAKLNA